MTRIDRHINAARRHLTFGRFLEGLGWNSLALGAVVLVVVLVDRLFAVRPPLPWVFLWAGVGVAVFFAIGYALLGRPSAQEAAVAIDERLGLKEKYSTALHVRGASDPFALAALRDAERTADSVDFAPRRYFPLRLPRTFFGTGVTAVTALALLYFIQEPLDLLKKEEDRRQVAMEAEKQLRSKETIEQALAVVQAQAKQFPSDETIANAQRDLELMLAAPPKDPQAAARSALKALQDSRDALKEQIANSQQYARAESNSKLFRSMTPPADDKSPVAEAQRAIAQGDFSKAAKEVQKLAEDFKQMDQPQQQQAAQRMAQMAQQLQQMANDPAKQQQLQQQLQRMGANQQQAQQMAQMMQQATQGDQQAQQQLQQMQQQMMQQMNNGQGPNQQQQQQIQQMMQQMQAQAQSMAQAQQMAQAAQAMAQAMQGQQQQGGQQQGQQGQQVPGQQGNMSAAAQDLQQQLEQMGAQQDFAQQMQEMEAWAQGACEGAAGACNGQGQGMAQGGWKAGDANKKGNGMGGPGIGRGGDGQREAAPFTVKAEKAPVQNQEDGKLLAAYLVKAGTVKGESKEQLKEVARAAQTAATDEIDQELVGRRSQKVVREYFGSIEKDVE